MLSILLSCAGNKDTEERRYIKIRRPRYVDIPANTNNIINRKSDKMNKELEVMKTVKSSKCIGHIMWGKSKKYIYYVIKIDKQSTNSYDDYQGPIGRRFSEEKYDFTHKQFVKQSHTNVSTGYQWHLVFFSCSNEEKVIISYKT